TGDAVVSSTLASLDSNPKALVEQPDPLIDVAIDRDVRSGVLATVSRGADSWHLALRTFDARNGDVGPQVPIGDLALPPRPGPSGVPSPSPADPNIPDGGGTYVDGPHIRLAPNGRTAFLWANLQRYTDPDPPIVVHGAWRIRFDAAGAVEDVAEAPGLL